jgi:beta-lactamase regulating signal transducer with metallopeptidase domain
MIAPAVIGFSMAAAAMVWLAGRKDAARDPRLTLWVLMLLGAFPALTLLPKVTVPGFTAGNTAWVAWLGWAWAAGTVLFSLRLAVALYQLMRWRKRSVPVIGGRFAHHKPEVRMLDGLACPVAAGVFRPLILVPPSWHRWSGELRETVVAHESAHHARRDPLWRAIAAITSTLHWFNPLVWWMASRLADQCEYACDERVLNEGLSPDRYANALCDVATELRAPATTLAMASHQGLEARVRRMLAPPPGRASWGVACLGFLALLSAVAFAVLEQAPVDWIPAADIEDARTRLGADPFPADP